MTGFSLPRILASLAEHNLLVSAAQDLPEAVRSVSDDSRAIRPGDLFVAVSGYSHDGHQFIDAAHASGAVAAIVERPGSRAIPNIIVRDSRAAATVVAATFYQFPARELRLVAATGTNGKTTTVHLLRHLLHKPDRYAASIGTLGVILGSNPTARTLSGETSLTTPGAIELQRILRNLVDIGVMSVALEASSHSLDQRRLDGLEFEAGIFSNFTRDHIDYHQTFEAYFAAKARLCSLVSAGGTIVVNDEDEHWLELPVNGKRVIRFSTTSTSSVVHSADVTYHPRGSSWTLMIDGERRSVNLPLIGSFNVSNALAAAAAAWSLGISGSTIAARLSDAPQVPGRMEVLHDDPVVLRDYAHTPDALERAISAVRPFAPNGVVVLFGCGGDRDRGKRPAMGEVAARLADDIVITSDNPRTEDPEVILDEIEAGMAGVKHHRIEDRRNAIASAMEIGRASGKIVLLAGKGHETYQIRGTEKLDFDERRIVRELVGATA